MTKQTTKTAAAQKPKMARASCPKCDTLFRQGNPGVERTPMVDLRLNPNTGNYTCQKGHEMTLDQLREGLKSAQETVQKQTLEAPVLSQPGDETGEIKPKTTVLEREDFTQNEDDLAPVAIPLAKAALQANGDMLVTIAIPELMVGPATELATQEGKTLDAWVEANLCFWLEDFFSAPMSAAPAR